MIRKKENISGWLNLAKPVGISSMQATAKARYTLAANKAGHAGTLDPLAEGVLPVAFGEATKLIPLLHDDSKTYRFTIRWGVQTNTDDLEGESVATSDIRPTQDAILAALPRFTGLIQQVPPAFSAIKIDGERAYARARAGEAVDMPSREVQIYDFKLISMIDADHSQFEINCGTGTYVRALARDLALFLGTCGHCTQIIRTRVGHFHLKDAILLDSLAQMPYESARTILTPLAYGLDDIPALAITEEESLRLRRGQDVRFLSRSDVGRLPADIAGPVLAMHQDQLVAICSLDGVTLHPERVINHS
jgi:tRNA pseudouridine55 synthase